jgi:hypothetical protein
VLRRAQNKGWSPAPPTNPSSLTRHGVLLTHKPVTHLKSSRLVLPELLKASPTLSTGQLPIRLRMQVCGGWRTAAGRVCGSADASCASTGSHELLV